MIWSSTFSERWQLSHHAELKECADTVFADIIIADTAIADFCPIVSPNLKL